MCVSNELRSKRPLFVLAAALLMASCQRAENSTEAGGAGPASVHEPEVPGFPLNSTNMTHFTYGVAANAVAVLLYGSTFVPVKRIETGDGMFFQWVNCAAIWVVSMVGDLMLQSPKFYPFAMLGGAIWATGNITVVPIIKAIGLSLGILIWGSTSLLMGWASSRFGWFGIAPQDVSRPVLNYCGAGLCLLSGLIFFFVKTDVDLHPESESVPLLLDGRTNSSSYGHSSSGFWIDGVRPKTRRLIPRLHLRPVLRHLRHQHRVLHHLLRCHEQPPQGLFQSHPPRAAVGPDVGPGHLQLVPGQQLPQRRCYVSHCQSRLRSGRGPVGSLGVPRDQGIDQLFHLLLGLLRHPDWLHADGRFKAVMRSKSRHMKHEILIFLQLTSKIK